MNEQAFLKIIQEKAGGLGINPFLLLSGIEGLYTFRNVPLNTINYQFLDSLILTIFALRIGDQFHRIAQENLISPNEAIRNAAAYELKPMTEEEMVATASPYLESFVKITDGKSIVRHYHIKALEAAAQEISAAHLKFGNTSISTLIIEICKNELGGELDLQALFSS